MPYKDKKKQRAAMRKISKEYRARQRQNIQKLKSQFPDIYTVIFGKPLRRSKK
jgi:hypothetical protein